MHYIKKKTKKNPKKVLPQLILGWTYHCDQLTYSESLQRRLVTGLQLHLWHSLTKELCALVIAFASFLFASATLVRRKFDMITFKQAADSLSECHSFVPSLLCLWSVGPKSRADASNCHTHDHTHQNRMMDDR